MFGDSTHLGLTGLYYPARGTVRGQYVRSEVRSDILVVSSDSSEATTHHTRLTTSGGGQGHPGPARPQ